MSKNRITFTDDFVLRDEKIGIGTTNPFATLTVIGDTNISGIVTASSFSGDGSDLIGFGGNFDGGITDSIYVPVTAGIGTDEIDTRNIFVGPGIAYSFSSSADKAYVVESIHITNKSGNDLYITGRQDFDGGANTPIANRVIVPYQGSLELLEQPMVANPSDIIRLQALTSQGEDAEGHNGGIDAFIVFSKKESSNYIGTGNTITSTDQQVFLSSNNPSVIQSIRLINYDNNIDVDASVSIFRNANEAEGGVRLGYLVFNLTIPKNSTVEILQGPKYLIENDAIKVNVSKENSLSCIIAGKYIV